ncbi:MAG: hypothetical protein ACRCZF_11650, partial [Gemmataceae bacterium]
MSPTTVPPPAPTPTGWGDLITLDARSIALLRIALGLFLFVDLAWRSVDFTAHYTDDGVLPRAARIAAYDRPEYPDRQFLYSFHMAAAAPGFTAALFGMAGLAYLALAVGYRCRWATVIAFVLNCSLQTRNPLLNDGSDTFARVMLFWGMFLPWEARFSVDARLGAGVRVPDRLCSMATAAYIGQTLMIYLFGAFIKTDPAWTSEFTAVHYVVGNDCFATALGRQLQTMPALTQFLTASSLVLEWVAPLLILVPARWGWGRLILIGCFWSFHVGTALMLRLGIFPLIAMTIWLALLPPLAWEHRRSPLPKLVAFGARRLLFLERWLPWLVTPTPRAAAPSRGTQWFLAVLLLYTVLWNVRSVGKNIDHLFPPGFNIPGRVLGLEQTWGFFAPKPMNEDGWYAMQGILADGTRVNLWAEAEPLP